LLWPPTSFILFHFKTWCQHPTLCNLHNFCWDLPRHPISCNTRLCAILTFLHIAKKHFLVAQMSSNFNSWHCLSVLFFIELSIADFVFYLSIGCLDQRITLNLVKNILDTLYLESGSACFKLIIFIQKSLYNEIWIIDYLACYRHVFVLYWWLPMIILNKYIRRHPHQLYTHVIWQKLSLADDMGQWMRADKWLFVLQYQ
jgi:hypothetical protein